VRLQAVLTIHIANFGNSKFTSIFGAVNLPIILILYRQTVDIVSQHKYIECDDQYRLLIHEYVRSQTVYKYHSPLIVKRSTLHLNEPHVPTRCKACGKLARASLGLVLPPSTRSYFFCFQQEGSCFDLNSPSIPLRISCCLRETGIHPSMDLVGILSKTLVERY